MTITSSPVLDQSGSNMGAALGTCSAYMYGNACCGHNACSTETNKCHEDEAKCPRRRTADCSAYVCLGQLGTQNRIRTCLRSNCKALFSKPLGLWSLQHKHWLGKCDVQSKPLSTLSSELVSHHLKAVAKQQHQGKYRWDI